MRRAGRCMTSGLALLASAAVGCKRLVTPPTKPTAPSPTRHAIVATPLRIELRPDASGSATTFRVNDGVAGDAATLEERLRSAIDEWKKTHSGAPPVTIDADTRVPWNQVVLVMNVGKKLGVGEVEFAFGAPPK